MGARLCICGIGMVRHRMWETAKVYRANHVKRYWISYTWVEAEPVGKGISPPRTRDYFHRYKIRFDWIKSQGEPWWHCESYLPLDFDILQKNRPTITVPQTLGCAGAHEEVVSGLRTEARLNTPAEPFLPVNSGFIMNSPGPLLSSNDLMQGDSLKDKITYRATESCGEWPGDKEMTSCLPVITDQTEELQM